MTDEKSGTAPAPGDVTKRREALPTDKPLVEYGGRVENPAHRPDPYAQYGNLDTSGSTLPSEQMAAISPVFEEARAANLVTAARALDPADPTPRELVVTPEGSVTVQGTTKTLADAHEDVYGALERQYEQPVVLGTGGPAAAAAAEGTDPESADENNPELEDLDYQERRAVAEGSESRTAAPIVTSADVAREESSQDSGGSSSSTSSSTQSSGGSGTSSSSTKTTAKTSGSSTTKK